MRLSKLLSGAALLLGLGVICQAGTITATFNSVNTFGQSSFSNGQGTTVDITLKPYPGTVGSNYTVEGDGGEYLWTQNSGTPVLNNNGAPGSFYTFCVELTQDIGFSGQYTYTTEALTDVPHPTLYGYAAMNADQAGDIDNLWANEISAVTNNDAAIEFQTAVWDIIYDYQGTNSFTSFDTNLSVGIDSSSNKDATNPLTSSSLQSTVNGWVTTAINDENAGDKGNQDVIALESDSNQDQITCLAPLPSTAMTGYAILGVLGAARLIRRRGLATSN